MKLKGLAAIVMTFTMWSCGNPGTTKFETHHNTKATYVFSTSRPAGKAVKIPEAESTIYFSPKNWDSTIKTGSDIKKISYLVKTTLGYDRYVGTSITDDISKN